MTMGLMFAALIALYEVSLLIARVVLARRIKRQNEELAREEAGEPLAKERVRAQGKQLNKKAVLKGKSE